jgi:hypothetical protein
MSTSSDGASSEPRDDSRDADDSRDPEGAEGADGTDGPDRADRAEPRAPKAALVFDDPLDRQSSDDTDHGWGERPRGGDAAADLRRFLDEKPPHHL